MTTSDDPAAGLAKLRKIRDAGIVRSRKSDGAEVVFADGADLRQRIESAKADVKEAAGAASVRTAYASFDRS